MSTAIRFSKIKSSPQLAALELLDRVWGQRDKAKIPIFAYVYLSKAFDNMIHKIYVIKPTYYGVTDPSKKLVESYLCNRHLTVRVGNIKSTMRLVSTGVSQGTLVNPLLLNIFINNIQKANLKFAFILYTDDTALNYIFDFFENRPEEIQIFIMSDLKKKIF